MDKQKLKTILNKLEKTTDLLGAKIDNKIVKAVAVFNYLGFTTTQSCEGHLDHGYISPWIQFGPKQNKTNLALEKKIIELYKKPHDNKVYKKIDSLEKKLINSFRKDLYRLTDLLNVFYETRDTAFDQRLILVDLKTRIQLIAQGAQFQELFSKKEKREKLALYQKEFSKFIHFISE